jgi:methyl-accepting chemotaxis protein
VTDIVGEISTAAKEQAVGIDHINGAIGQMNSVTQQNAASSEESSSAASELSSQSERLAAMLGEFQLNGLATAHRPAPGTAAASARKTLRVKKGNPDGAGPWTDRTALTDEVASRTES